MCEFCFAQADNGFAHHGMTVDDFSRLKLAKAMGAAFQRASSTISELAEGRYAPDDVLIGAGSANGELAGHSKTAAAKTRTSAGKSPPLTLTGLFGDWWREAQAAGRKPSTHESYQSTVKSLVAFLKHDDAKRITAEGMVIICGVTEGRTS